MNKPLTEANAPLEAAARNACHLVPPLWPLASSVAVNPFLGHTGDSLAVAAARLEKTAGIGVTMPRDWYAEKIRTGEITDEDLNAAFEDCHDDKRPESLTALKNAADGKAPEAIAIHTLADIAAKTTGTDWPALIAERIGAWAACHFDRGQALWQPVSASSPWQDWLCWAKRDKTLSVAGLSAFHKIVSDIPDTPMAAIAKASAAIGITDEAACNLYHRLLTTLGGWAQFARYKSWQAELAGTEDDNLISLLAIRLTFEHALFVQFGRKVDASWQEALERFAEPLVPTGDHVTGSILQSAAERAFQRELAAKFGELNATEKGPERPALQAAFCIDVRSEPFRRALEAQDPSIRTLGFAGFFGLPAKHRAYASDTEELRLPVLLNPAMGSNSGPADNSAAREAESEQRFSARAKRAWGRFRQAAVSSFAFVEAAGLTYSAKLLADSLHRKSPNGYDCHAPRFDPELSLDDRSKTAETVLRAMSLTDGFAHIVLLAGHGASAVNNPHLSALQCGACGGHAGDVNARLLAGLLNDKMVRQRLEKNGISIPEDTLFIAALHDTTTDEVVLFDGDRPSKDHEADLAKIRDWLKDAGLATRTERTTRLPKNSLAADTMTRARDWAQTRPELGLAGCSAFIAAPRHLTTGMALGGRAFLHDYDPQRDAHNDYSVLQLIMTAPVVVASWISLQYYGSVVAPGQFGAGNKLLHNVTGGIGVVEGNGGILRGGLPWQSVHDGERFVHEPLRLTVCIQAPTEAMSAILERHPELQSLFDNRWLHLIAIDDEGQLAWRYDGNRSWKPMEESKWEPLELRLAS